MSADEENEGGISIQEAMVGVFALLAADHDQRARQDPTLRKTEVLLADAGVSVRTIARLLGKNVDAVRMSIRRARQRAPGRASINAAAVDD